MGAGPVRPSPRLGSDRGRAPSAAGVSDHIPPARASLTGPAPEVAPRLLGSLLTSDLGSRVSVRITEVEAYAGIGQDPGSHAHRRRTPRNAAMFGPVGHAYVYFTYGMHWCLNVVVHPRGEAGAVLIRAGEVVTGQATARTRRPAARTDRDLARGPARLAAALGVTGDLDQVDLLDPSSPLRLSVGPISAGPVTHLLRAANRCRGRGGPDPVAVLAGRRPDGEPAPPGQAPWTRSGTALTLIFWPGTTPTICPARFWKVPTPAGIV